MQWQLYSLLVYHLLLSLCQSGLSEQSLHGQDKSCFIDIDNNINRCILIFFISPVEIIIHYLVQDM